MLHRRDDGSCTITLTSTNRAEDDLGAYDGLRRGGFAAARLQPGARDVGGCTDLDRAERDREANAAHMFTVTLQKHRVTAIGLSRRPASTSPP